MKTCIKCNSTITDKSIFCPYCGETIVHKKNKIAGNSKIGKIAFVIISLSLVGNVILGGFLAYTYYEKNLIVDECEDLQIELSQANANINKLKQDADKANKTKETYRKEADKYREYSVVYDQLITKFKGAKVTTQASIMGGNCIGLRKGESRNILIASNTKEIWQNTLNPLIVSTEFGDSNVNGYYQVKLSALKEGVTEIKFAENESMTKNTISFIVLVY